MLRKARWRRAYYNTALGKVIIKSKLTCDESVKPFPVFRGLILIGERAQWGIVAYGK